MCRNQAGPKTHRATGGGLTVIMQSYLASRRQARPPSPLILRVLKDLFVDTHSFRLSCHTLLHFINSDQDSSQRSAQQKRLRVARCVLFILIAFLLSSLTPHFSFLMFSYISLASYPFFSYFLYSPNLYIYICVQHRIFVRI